MSEVTSFPPGNYRYLPGVFQYSGGVAAAPGFSIVRARLRRVLPLAQGFAAIAAHLGGIGRPLAAICACELRSPAPFSETGFVAFNRAYVAPLAEWGVIHDGVNPVARSNVCPEIDPPTEPGFYAFCYTVPSKGAAADFVAAGSGEAPEGTGSYAGHAVQPGDVSAAGLRDKARWVLGEMERRMGALGFDWTAASATQLYTVHDVHPILAEEIVRRGAAPAGLTWHYARPPVVGLDFEMDVRGVFREIVL